VLHVLPDLQIGGGQTIVLNHLRHADLRRFHITVTMLRSDIPGGSTMTDEFTETLGGPVIDLGHGTEVGDAGVVARLVRIIRRNDIDLIHVHSDVDRKLGQVAGLLTGTPVVGHLHAEWVHFGPMEPRRSNRFTRLRARGLAAVRDLVERRTVTHYIAESERVREIFRPLVDQPIDVLKQAIPSDRFGISAEERQLVRSELDISPEAPVIICVSRLVAGKGHHRLLESFASLRRSWPDLVAVLVGDGDLRPGLEAQARSLNIDHAVRFVGDRHDVPRLLGAADLFAFASETEGFGLCVLEAMAASLPVVAMHCPALEEFVAPGVTGDLVPQGDVDALTAAIHELLLDPRRSDRYGAAGRTVVVERFAPTAVAHSFEHVYDQVVPPTNRTLPNRNTQE
jgi:glycosyltransferase involved in cell wall biosynthesis